MIPQVQNVVRGNENLMLRGNLGLNSSQAIQRYLIYPLVVSSRQVLKLVNTYSHFQVKMIISQTKIYKSSLKDFMCRIHLHNLYFKNPENKYVKEVGIFFCKISIKRFPKFNYFNILYISVSNNRRTLCKIYFLRRNGLLLRVLLGMVRGTDLPQHHK